MSEPTDNLISSNTPNVSGFSQWISFERNEIFLLLSFFFFGLAFANYEPYAPFWLISLFQEESFLVIGLVVAIPSTVLIFGTAFFGFLADRYGIKKFVMFGVASFAIMFLCLIFTKTSGYFLVMVLVGSTLGSAQSSNFYALGTKTVNKPKEMIFAKMIASISLSWAIMSPITGWINDLPKVNSMQVQLVIAVVACVISLALSFFIKESSSESKEVKTENFKMGKGKITLFPFIFVLILILAFTYQITGGFWAFTSIYFLDTLKVNGSIYSILLIIKTTLAIPISIFFGRLVKLNKKSWVVVVVSGYQVLVFIFAVLFSTNTILMLLLMSIPMYPLYSIIFYSLVSRFSNSKRRATAYGIMNGIGTAGYVIGIIVLGMIGDAFARGIYTRIPSSLNAILGLQNKYTSFGIYAMLPASLIYTVIAFSMAIIFLIIQKRKNFENFSQK